MKKTILGLFALGFLSFTSLQSCKDKKEKIEDAVQDSQKEMLDTSAKAEDILSDVSKSEGEVAKKIPVFSSPFAQDFAKRYGDFVKEMNDAAKTGNATKVAEYQQKAVDFAKEMQDVAQKLSPDDAKKLKDWSTELNKATK